MQNPLLFYHTFCLLQTADFYFQRIFGGIPSFTRFRSTTTVCFQPSFAVVANGVTANVRRRPGRSRGAVGVFYI